MLRYRFNSTVGLLGKWLQLCWLFCWILPPQRGSIVSVLWGSWSTRRWLSACWDDVLEPSSLESRAASVLVVTRRLWRGLIFWSQACHKSVGYSTGVHNFCFSLPELQNTNSQPEKNIILRNVTYLQIWEEKKPTQGGIEKKTVSWRTYFI